MHDHDHDHDCDDEDEFERLLEEDPAAALDQARAWLADEPDSADAHYSAGLACEALGRHRQQVEHFLRVREIDAEEQTSPIEDHQRIILEEVEATLRELPHDFERRLGPVTILVEPRPSADLVEDGLDPRLLGLFDGATSEELSGADAPPIVTRILIFSHNLASAFEDEPSLRKEVRTTVLHEVGHFFGLDEDRLDELGLG